VLLAACSSPQQNDVEDTADRFEEAVGASNAPAACALLAPATREELEQSSGKPCDQAIMEEATPAGGRRGAEVFGSMGQVEFADDTVFLSQFDGRWLVVAASCTPGPHQVHDCKIQGR
jgi:hypothetical protein